MNQPSRLLIVDDEADIVANLSDILGDQGYQVDTACTAAEARRLFREREYDIALLDLKMPDADGLSLYRELKQIRAGTVAMIVTAYASPETTESALSAGAWKVLPKPVDVPRLIGLVAEALDQPLVLVVDDDRELCASLWDLLRERSFRVYIAHSVTDAESRLAARLYHVVMIDIKLPEGTGIDVLRRVREVNPAAKTVFITGYRSEVQELIEKAKAEGADAVCYKPFGMGELLATVRQLTESHSRKTD